MTPQALRPPGDPPGAPPEAPDPPPGDPFSLDFRKFCPSLSRIKLRVPRGYPGKMTKKHQKIVNLLLSPMNGPSSRKTPTRFSWGPPFCMK